MMYHNRYKIPHKQNSQSYRNNNVEPKNMVTTQHCITLCSIPPLMFKLEECVQSERKLLD